MSVLPRSLLWRTFLLLTLLMLLSVLAWSSIYAFFERAPRARQTAQVVISVVNLTRAALISADPLLRMTLLRELAEREGIRIYPSEDNEKLEPLPQDVENSLVITQVRADLGGQTRFAAEREGEAGFWVSFRIEDEDEYWVMLPPERIESALPLEWIGWGAAAMSLALLGAWVTVRRIARPLNALANAARTVGQGEIPPRLDETGPVELATVAHAFNQMSLDLAQLENDRALILAGISHDLRTPLARLRLGIEFSGADEATRGGMEQDIEDMDRIIAQFLDYGREVAPEGGRESCDVSAQVEDIAAALRRRGSAVQDSTSGPLQVEGRPGALRRAITNLVENALRYAGDAAPVEVSTRQEDGRAIIEVADRGPGIPPDQVARLKRPFTRLEGARSNAKGSGLGLAIVNRIAQSHGGSFDLLARPGGGLLARISLPAVATPAKRRSLTRRKPRDSAAD